MNPAATPDMRLARLLDQAAGILRGGFKGLEKESLRVNSKGCLAHTPHPRALGAALTHPHITTDYSEALIELVTAPYADTRDTLHALCDIHSFVYRQLVDEMLWATSMPCLLEGDSAIPIAEYGRSNVGMMKHIYRRGLGFRYGRAMQTISGIHFNYSFPERLWPALQAVLGDTRPLRDFTDEAYFGMLRNFLRVSWLLLYLFGASPALCKSFLQGRNPAGFSEFDAHTWYEPYATSLRMSDIGYKNKNQSRVGVSYNGLDDYVRTLGHAISTPEPEYQAIGVKVGGEYHQLNANILQIENEFYSFIRPKQPIRRGERASLALKKRGVMYAEVRALDVNAFEPLGTSTHSLHFIEALLISCLLQDSPPLSPAEQAAIAHNQTVTARRGREPGLHLVRDGGDIALRTWALEITDALDGICAALDGEDPAHPYSTALRLQREAIADPERTPSAHVLADMRTHGESFFAFARRLSERHRTFFLERSLDDMVTGQFVSLAEKSLADQAALEAADTLSFDDYLKQYFAQT